MPGKELLSPLETAHCPFSLPVGLDSSSASTDPQPELGAGTCPPAPHFAYVLSPGKAVWRKSSHCAGHPGALSMLLIPSCTQTSWGACAMSAQSQQAWWGLKGWFTNRSPERLMLLECGTQSSMASAWGRFVPPAPQASWAPEARTLTPILSSWISGVICQSQRMDVRIDAVTDAVSARCPVSEAP